METVMKQIVSLILPVLERLVTLIVPVLDRLVALIVPVLEISVKTVLKHVVSILFPVLALCLRPSASEIPLPLVSFYLFCQTETRITAGY